MEHLSIHSISRFRDVYYTVLFAMLLFIFFVLNFLTPMWNDDFAAYFSYAHPTEKISSIRGLVKSNIHLYLHFGGRFLICTYQQIVAQLGKQTFNLLNTIVFAISIVVICHFARAVKPINYLFVFGLMWLFLPSPGETLFWMTGSLGYFWGTMIFLLFLIYHDRIQNIGLLCIVSFVCGSLSENIFVTGFIFFLVLLTIEKQRSGVLNKNFLTIVIAFTAGALFLIFSPGSKERLFAMYGQTSIEPNFASFKNYITDFFKHSLVLLAIALFFCVFKSRRQAPSFLKSTNDSIALSMLIAGLIAPFSMIISPEHASRTTFPSFLLVICSIAYLVEKANADSQSAIFVRLNELFKLSFVLVALFSINGEVLNFFSLYKETQKNIEVINSSKQNGMLDVKVSDLPDIKSEYVFTYPIRLDSSYIANVHMAQFYGLNSIAVKSDFLKVNLEKNVVSAYCLTSEFSETKLPYKSCCHLYNMFDGNAVYLKLPNQPLASPLKVQFGNKIGQPFAIKSIELSISGKCINVPRNAISLFSDVKPTATSNSYISFVSTGSTPCLLINLDRDTSSNRIYPVI